MCEVVVIARGAEVERTPCTLPVVLSQIPKFGYPGLVLSQLAAVFALALLTPAVGADISAS
jgi:hypothetical protein